MSPTTRCARCGEVEVPGEREDQPICPGCVFEMLGEAQAETRQLLELLRALAAESPHGERYQRALDEARKRVGA